MVNSIPKHKVPTCVNSPFTVVVSENVFCQGMVVLLNPVCILLSGMLHVCKSEVHLAVFETYVMTSKTLASIDPAIENRKIVLDF